MKYIFFIILGFLSGSVLALSCAPTQDRIFGKCHEGVCSKFLYVREVSSYSHCSRRPALEKLPVWGKEVLEFEIASNSFSASIGVYELVLDGSKWSGNYMFSDAKEYRLFSEKSKDKQYQLGVLTPYTAHTINELEKLWGGKESKGYQKMLFFKSLNWFLLALAFLLLIYSILCFYKWQRSLISVRWVALGVGAQALILIIAFISMSAWSIPLIAFIGIFIPGVWLYQITSFISFFRSNRDLK